MNIYTVIDLDSGKVLVDGMTRLELSHWHDSNPYMRVEDTAQRQLTDGSLIITKYVKEIG